MNSKNILKDNSLRETKARVDILDVLIDSDKPLSYEVMKDMLSVDMDKTTFYRNMATLEDSSIVNKFEADDKRWYFELKTSKHGHFFCRVCNQIECIHDINITIDSEYTIENIIIKGICKNCK
jgi:Fur family ferric uptake transcriptional regulator